MREPSRDRRAVRAAGQRRVQTVTTWTAAGSVLAAVLLAAALAHGTAAARNSAGDQLQTPDNPPAISGLDDGTHSGTGGS